MDHIGYVAKDNSEETDSIYSKPDITLANGVKIEHSTGGEQNLESPIYSYDEIRLQYTDSKSFKIWESEFPDVKLDIRIVSFGRTGYVLFDGLGIFPLLRFCKIARVQNQKFSSSRNCLGIIVRFEDDTDLDILECNLKMFSIILEQLSPHLERYLDKNNNEMVNLVDSYNIRDGRETIQQRYAEWIHHQRMFTLTSQQQHRSGRQVPHGARPNEGPSSRLASGTPPPGVQNVPAGASLLPGNVPPPPSKTQKKKDSIWRKF